MARTYSVDKRELEEPIKISFSSKLDSHSKLLTRQYEPAYADAELDPESVPAGEVVEDAGLCSMIAQIGKPLTRQKTQVVVETRGELYALIYAALDFVHDPGRSWLTTNHRQTYERLAEDLEAAAEERGFEVERVFDTDSFGTFFENVDLTVAEA